MVVLAARGLMGPDECIYESGDTQYIARHEHGNAVVRLEDDVSSCTEMLMLTSAVLNIRKGIGLCGPCCDVVTGTLTRQGLVSPALLMVT